MQARYWIALACSVALAAGVARSSDTAGPATTRGDIALGNLDAEIAGLDALGADAALDTDLARRLSERLEMRGRFTGRIADYRRVDRIATDCVARHPREPGCWLLRAKADALLHRFEGARQALTRARELGTPATEAAVVAASLDQATGHFDAAKAYHTSGEKSGTAAELGALAALYGEQGEVEAARRAFAEARAAWARSRDVSPFTIAWLDFEEGLMWMNHGMPEKARPHLERAAARLPGYAPAQGHLAEVEADLGERQAALARLRELVRRSDDPDYAHQLARIAGESGRGAEATHWRAKADEGFRQLVADYPEAFADHAAEFWLGIGDDPTRALALARLNAAQRQTPRARELLDRATAAARA